MDPIKQSDAFKTTIFIWKIFGLWSDKSSSKYFRIYSFVFILFTSILFFFSYTLSLIYTPFTVEIFATEAIFYFTILSGLTKTFVFLTKRNEIISVFETMDCKEFRDIDDKTNKYVRQFKTTYIRYFRAYGTHCNISGYTFLIGLPLLNYFTRHEELKLPICKYYFLTDEIRNKYFVFWYAYQTVCLASSMTNNITSHTFLCGLLSFAVTQFKILNWNLANIRLDDEYDDDSDIIRKNIDEKEQIYLNKLHNCLKHYEIIMKYCKSVQSITDFLIFAHFGLAALTFCFCMTIFFLPISQKDLVFMGCFTTVMLLDNFAPSLLGSQLTYESSNVMFAAYSNNWIPRSKRFKTCLMILVERANRPIVITGLKMVPLSLNMFASIVKTAYSFFTLLSGVQD